jgi:hypothetical protein
VAATHILANVQLIIGSALNFMPIYLPERPGNCVDEILAAVSCDPNGTNHVALQQKSLSLVLYGPVQPTPPALDWTFRVSFWRGVEEASV